MGYHVFDVEYTDTFAGEPNYGWVRRTCVTVPDLVHYGYDGSSNYTSADKKQRVQIMRQAKANLGLTGVKGRVSECGDTIEFRPANRNTVMFIRFNEEKSK